jgi:acyl-CoA thioester hydrolase
MDTHDIKAEIEFSVEFYDIDSLNIVWHGNYMRYFEMARRALLETINFGYAAIQASGYVFPVTDVSMKYIKPLRLGDRVRARAILDEYENCLRILYELYNAKTGELTTQGRSTQMAYDIAGKSSCFVCPRVFTEKIEAYLAGPRRKGEK